MKAVFRFTLLFVLFLGLIPSSCNTGKCDDPGEYKLDLNDFSLQLRGAGLKAGIPASVVPQGEFLIQIFLIGEPYTVGNFLPETPLFTQTLMARDPCQPNFCTGFSEEIDSFTISCDTMFQGVATGLSLNPYFDVLYRNKYSSNWMHDTLVAISGFNEAWRKDPLLLVNSNGTEPFKIKPKVFIQPGYYRFTVTMLLKDGTLINKEADIVHFE